MSNSWIDSGDGTGIFCDADADKNLLQLKLKKPKAWKWELTTSRSSPNIALPRIMLFNHKGDLLVDANKQGDDVVYKSEKPPKLPKRKARKLLRAVTTNLESSIQDDEDTGLGSLDSAERHTYKPSRKDNSLRSRGNQLSCRRMTRDPKVAVDEQNFNGQKSWRHSLPEEIDIGTLQICEATDSDQTTQKSMEDITDYTPWVGPKIIEPPTHKDNHHYMNTSQDRHNPSKASSKSFHSIAHFDADPVKQFERRASSFKEVRFKVHPASDDEEQKPREKRRNRRPNTSNSTLTSSSSILERLSAMKCRLSSPEFDNVETHQVEMGPRYYLRTSRAGTLVVAEENFNKLRRIRRRQPKTSSTENVLSPSSSSMKMDNSFKEQGLLGANLGVPCSQSQSMNSFGEINKSQRHRPRRKTMPIRRHKSDGNILLASSSDEEEQPRSRSGNSNSLRNRTNGFLRHKQEDAKN